MTDMARDYHNSIQDKDLPEEYGRIMATEITLEKCNVHLSESEFKEMDKALDTQDVGEALRLSNNGKAPGIDGIPYEFYKIQDILFKENRATKNDTFDVVGFLTKLYEDIEQFGMVKNCKFNMGWMCPIFKKALPS
ncbi:hypothetical protein B0H14DRAFT_2394240 [Mycena olivaceomarginata]|nr:hypothetical protein B0H14DRAFT_2394240 [Mycena olivaceomarginata]